MDIKIEKVILHGLDPASGAPVLSEELIQPDEQVREYLKTHFLSCFESDSVQKSIFLEESQLKTVLQHVEEDFIGVSRWIGDAFYQVLSQNPGVPAGDLICMLCTDHEGARYFAVLKMNYHDGFAHFYSNGCLSIVGQRVLLPGVGRKLEEAFIVCLESMEIKLMEKKYEMVDESRAFYLSTRILQCLPSISERSKLMAVKKAVQKANKEVLGNQKSVEQELLARMHTCLTEEDAPTVSGLCRGILEEYPQIEPMVREQLQGEDIQPDDRVQVSAATVKRLEKQSVKSSGGVEIKIPADLYQDRNAVEFINNPDGTISLLIKNILL